MSNETILGTFKHFYWIRFVLTQRWQKLMNLRLQKFSRSPASRHSKKSLSFSLTTMMNEDRQLATWTLHKQDNDDIYLVAGQILHCGRRPIINLWFLATLEAAKRDLWQMDFELSRKVELFFRMVNIPYYWFLCMHTLCQKSYFGPKISFEEF